MRGISDCNAIRNYGNGIDRIAVIGGGLLGPETAHALKSLVKQVAVIEANKWLLPRQLDVQAVVVSQPVSEAAMVWLVRSVLK